VISTLFNAGIISQKVLTISYNPYNKYIDFGEVPSYGLTYVTITDPNYWSLNLTNMQLSKGEDIVTSVPAYFLSQDYI